MKTLYKYLLAAMVAGGTASCSTDIETPQLEGFDDLDPMELKASTDNVALEGVDENKEVLTLAWGTHQLTVDNPDYAVPDGSVENYIEMSATADFADVQETFADGNSKTFTERELNPVLVNLGFEEWQPAPLYIRIRYDIAENTAPLYSSTVEITASAYGIRFNRMDMLVSPDDPGNVLGSLYSPAEDGVYTGYVAASSWLNFWLMERDNTVWGSLPGSAFTMKKYEGDTQATYNLWFPGVGGSFRVTADRNTLEWSAEYLKSMTLTSGSGNSTEMKFTMSANSWTATVRTTGAETFTAVAATTMYNSANENGADGQPIDFGQILTIPEAGDWLVTFNMSGGQPTATYAVDDTPAATYGPYLEMVDPGNHDDVKSRLYSPASDGVYTGFHYSGEWENYKFATVDRSTVYGSMPNALTELSSASDSWNIYIDTGAEGLYYYTVSLPDNTWSYKAISKLVVRGDHDLVSEMAYDKENKVWTADLDITADGWGMQILVNDDWGDIFKMKGDGVLGYNEGDNIPFPGTGKYRLTVSLFDMGNLTYTLTQL